MKDFRAVPWARKHDEPGMPVVRRAPLVRCPESLEDLIEICSGRRGAGLKAAGSHWGLSTAAISDQVFIETHEPNGRAPAMGRTLFDVIPKCMSQSALDFFKNAPRTEFDDDTTENKGCYFVHFESGKRVYQLYAELDQGDDDNPDSLARFITNGNLLGPWALPTMGGAGGQTVVGALTSGTHGGDIRFPPIADAVVAIHLVADGGKHYWIEPKTPILVDGQEFQLTESDKLIQTYGRIGEFEVVYDDDLFNAVLISAGRFGIIYSVVMRAVRQYCLHEHREMADWEDIRDQLKDPNSQLFDRRYLEIVVFPPPHKNFTRHGASITKRWNTPASLAGGSSNPIGRKERRGDMGNFDPAINAARFTMAGNSHPYNPDGKDYITQFLQSSTANPDLLLGVIEEACAEIKNFLATNAVAAGSVIAAVVALAGINTLLVLLAPLALLVLAVLALLAALRAAGATRMGDVLEELRRCIFDGSPPGTPRCDAAIFFWQVIYYGIFQTQRGAVEYDAISYAIMDRHDYPDKSGAINADSIEIFFDANGDDLVPFINSLLEFELMREREEGLVYAGWFSLRFMAPTRASLGTQKFQRTCAVEIAGLKDISGTIGFIEKAEQIASDMKCIFHWGQRNNQRMQHIQAMLGDAHDNRQGPLERWRGALARITDNGRLDAFSNDFSRSRGLEIVQPRIMAFALENETVVIGNPFVVILDVRSNPPATTFQISVLKDDGTVLRTVMLAVREGRVEIGGLRGGHYRLRMNAVLTLNGETREDIRVIEGRVKLRRP